ncbi:hypothetical protein MMPV_008587 [Pyropia vietnamensis]
MDLPAPASSRRPPTLRKPSPLPLLLLVVTIAFVVAGYHHLSTRISSTAAAPVVPAADAAVPSDHRTAAALSAGQVAAAAAAAGATIPPPGGDPAGIVRSLVASQPVLIFSKSYCPYSARAKAALAAAVPAGAPPPTVIELDLREDGAALQAALQAATGRSTVPNVFIGGHPVGGSEEVAALAAEGKLDALVREAPAQLVAKTA